MKLLVAVVHNDDTYAVNNALTDAGFQLTKISSTGGFLHSGNSTFLSGVEEDKVDEFINIISKNCSSRIQAVPNMTLGLDGYAGYVNKVNVGGATVFVLDVEKYVHL